MKRFIASLFAALLAAQAWAQDFTIDNLSYYITDADNHYVSVCSGPVMPTGDLAIPSTVSNGGINYTVTEISDWAFYGCRDLTSVAIPESITSINHYAFSECSGLTSITIPKSVTSIGCTMVMDCNNLTAINVDSENENYSSSEDGVLFNKDKTTLICCPAAKTGEYSIPEGVTTIGDYAFWGCVGLTSVIIPETVKSLGTAIFHACTSLTSVHIPKSVNSIAFNTFLECYNLTTIYVDSGNEKFSAENGVLFNKDKTTLFCYPAGKSGAYTIPESVSRINDASFYGCRNLTSVTIPNSITAISYVAFHGCSGLTTLTIPETVTVIERGAFEECTGLTSVNIPENVTKIGYEAFCYCSSLNSLSIPEKVTEIGSNAFNGVRHIVYSGEADGAPWGASYINGSVEGDFVYADAEKTQLVAYVGNDSVVIIPNTVKSIDDYAFQNCSTITSITIPESVETISGSAFYNCNIKNLTYNTDAIGTLFRYNTSLETVTIGDAITSIPDEMFQACHNLKSVNFGTSVKTIGAYAFNDCALTSLDIPNTVENIGDCAFNYNPNLLSVNIPASVKSFGDRVFSGANIKTISYNTDAFRPDFIDKTNLETVVIGDSVTSIPDNAFSGCSNLTSVTLGNSVEIIGDAAFEYCSNLTSVTFGNSVKTIGDYAFYNCYGLKSIEIPSSADTVGDYAFWLCDNIKTLTYNTDAFNPSTINNSNLETVVIGDAVTIIPYCAFYNCSNLQSVTLGNSVESIGDYAFYNCSNLTSIDLPESVTYIGPDAFTGTNVPEEDLKLKNQEENQEGNQNKQNNQNQLVLNGIIYKVSGSSVTVTGYNKDTYLTNVTIPETVTIDEVTYPVTDIASKAFASNLNLKSVTIGSNIETIGESAFSNCRRIESIDIKSSSVTIGDKAFRGCHSAQTVYLPSTVKSVGTEAFMFVKNIEYHGSIDQEPWRALTVNGYVEGDYVYADESKTTLTGYFGDGGDIEIPYGVETIGQYSFFESLGLTSVNIPSTVISIGKGAFSNCHDLESVFVPNSVVMVSADAFCACEGSTIYCQFPEKPAQWSSKWNYQQGGSVVWSSITDINESAADCVNIYTTDKKIVVENATDDILVYNAMGILIGRDAIHRVRTEIPVNALGVYIVKTGSNVKRVVVN